MADVGQAGSQSDAGRGAFQVVHGYDAADVDEFLRSVLDRIDHLEQQIVEANARADEAEGRARALGAGESTFVEMLDRVQQTAERMIKEASDVAAQLVANARHEADAVRLLHQPIPAPVPAAAAPLAPPPPMPDPFVAPPPPAMPDPFVAPPPPPPAMANPFVAPPPSVPVPVPGAVAAASQIPVAPETFEAKAEAQRRRLRALLEGRRAPDIDLVAAADATEAVPSVRVDADRAGSPGEHHSNGHGAGVAPSAPGDRPEHPSPHAEP